MRDSIKDALFGLALLMFLLIAVLEIDMLIGGF